jgi:cellulose synthase/poly-beta-1,6-N-acetylglucosamine synthase-like glycosyltransferase
VTALALTLMAIPLGALVYAYVLYPAGLWCLTRRRATQVPPRDESRLPSVTLTIPVHNEEGILRRTLEHVLALDYPASKLHVLVISDASTDGTDTIAREFASRGVELIRLPQRAGKTAAENAAAAHIRGEIVVNVDATARPGRSALRALIAAFDDPTVGVASGRDISTGAGDEQTRAGESGYVGYEMWTRGLETRFGSIVGASGCFYGIRGALYQDRFPEALSRDFASPLIAREHGFRAVSVDAAVCAVPRAKSLEAEFRRKVRTMHRGLETLWYKRALLNPLRYGRFAFMLFSHKLCRWLVPLTLPLGLLGLIILAAEWTVGAWLLGVVSVSVLVSLIAARRRESSRVLSLLALPSYVLVANVAGVAAWWETVRQKREAMWEPTRRDAVAADVGVGAG